MTSEPTGPAPLSVLIVSASMGAGHDGAARELSRRLRAGGHRVTVVDYLAAVPLRLGPVVRSSYKWQLRLAPSTYEASYQTWVDKPSQAGPLATALSAVTGPALRRWVTQARPDVIVSTYPLCSLVLGRDRLRGRLAMPVATFITDFAVHPLWTHPGVDLHLTVHPQAAADAQRLSGRAGAAPGPLVPKRFMGVEVDGPGAPAGPGAPGEPEVSGGRGPQRGPGPRIV
ncbi:MAG: MGDG synthase family glycosyltransferase [Acidimicrobiales bacterium]